MWRRKRTGGACGAQRATRAAPRLGWRPGGRMGWRALPLALLAPLLALLLVGCSARLTGPVTLASTPAHGVTVPAQIRKGDGGATLVIVEVVIEGKGPYPMALDTGASLSLLDRALTKRLNLRVTGSAQQITGVGGSQEVLPVAVNSWSVGAAQLPAMTVTSAQLNDLQRSAGIIGLLGSDALSRYGAVTVDYTDSQVTFYHIAQSGLLPSLAPLSAHARLPTLPL